MIYNKNKPHLEHVKDEYNRKEVVKSKKGGRKKTRFDTTGEEVRGGER